MKALTFTTDEKRQARLSKFRKKAPKKPRGKTESSLNNFLSRYNDWVKDLKEASKRGKKLDDLKKEVAKAKR